MLDDLRDGHHQPDGGRLLGEQRAEIDGDRLHRIECGIHRAEQDAAMRGVLRRVGDAETLAHRVVELRRIQPHMRVRQR